jgi:5-methylcytosine-specific restriction protein A
MPTRPPNLKQRRATQPKQSNWNRRASRQERGYGRAHDLMREQVLREEPLCRLCREAVPPRVAASVIADHIMPKAEGGDDDRTNYQGLCHPCHRAKTTAEAARAKRRLRATR